jgi:hypothetical protein
VFRNMLNGIPYISVRWQVKTFVLCSTSVR